MNNSLAVKVCYGVDSSNHRDNLGHLKWLHIIISNAKVFIGGTYHGLGRKHLKFCPGEYCYRLNRRRFKGQLFNPLLVVCVSTNTVKYEELVGTHT